MLIAMICCLRYVDIFSTAQQAGEENISAKKYAYKHPSISTVVCVIRFCERCEITGPDLRAPAPAAFTAAFASLCVGVDDYRNDGVTASRCTRIPMSWPPFLRANDKRYRRHASPASLLSTALT
jgi:hypothetical protein